MKKRLIELAIVTSIVCSYSNVFAEANLEQGLNLFTTSNSIAENSSGKSCASCHLNGKGFSKTYSKSDFYYQGAHMRGIQEAVNFCVVRNVKGKPLESNSDEMLSILEYIKQF